MKKNWCSSCDSRGQCGACLHADALEAQRRAASVSLSVSAVDHEARNQLGEYSAEVAVELEKLRFRLSKLEALAGGAVGTVANDAHGFTANGVESFREVVRERDALRARIARALELRGVGGGYDGRIRAILEGRDP